jgi:hypothetical protein
VEATRTAHRKLEDFRTGTRVHDVDSHVSEPPDLWTRRMAKKWGDEIPHLHSGPANWETYHGEKGLRSRCTRDSRICDQLPDSVGNNYNADTARGAHDPWARLAPGPLSKRRQLNGGVRHMLTDEGRDEVAR